mgnify:CR=1 FL=1
MNSGSETKEITDQETQNDFERHHWISVAAYFRAEKRGWLPDKELDDWLEAELDYMEMQIKSFILRSREDGLMTIADLRKLAYSVGVKEPDQINQEVELIREVQNACRHRPCFQSDKRMLCEEAECEWTQECRKLIAVWNR